MRLARRSRRRRAALSETLRRYISRTCWSAVNGRVPYAGARTPEAEAVAAHVAEVCGGVGHSAGLTGVRGKLATRGLHDRLAQNRRIVSVYAVFRMSTYSYTRRSVRRSERKNTEVKLIIITFRDETEVNNFGHNVA